MAGRAVPGLFAAFDAFADFAFDDFTDFADLADLADFEAGNFFPRFDASFAVDVALTIRFDELDGSITAGG